MMKKTTAPETAKAAEKAVPVNVLADPVVVKVEEPAKPKRGRKPKAEQSCCRERDGDVAGEHEDRVELREERAVHEGGGAERQKQRDEPARGARLLCSAFRFHVAPFRSFALPSILHAKTPCPHGTGGSLL